MGGKDANNGQMEVLQAQKTGGLKRTFTTIVNGSSALKNGATKSTSANQESATGSAGDLAGLEMNGHTEEPKEPKAPNLASAIHLTPDWEAGYNRLFFSDEGILFEDAQIQVGLRSEYRGHLGVLKLYFKNKASFAIGSFTTTLDNKSNPDLKIDTRELPEPSIGSGSQTQQTIFCTAQAPFLRVLPSESRSLPVRSKHIPFAYLFCLTNIWTRQSCQLKTSSNAGDKLELVPWKLKTPSGW